MVEHWQWEMERQGHFSSEGVLELAWLTGLVRYHNGRLPDGSHYIPFETQRMWKDTPKAEYFKCLLSSSVVLAFLAGIYLYCGSLSKMAYYYGVPYFVYGWWLFTVTYLQHHNPETVAYPGAT